MRDQINGILKRNLLSVTESRKKILELFLQSSGALAHADIEKKTGEKFDRVTVYRTLHSFLNKGIIHSIPSADNAIRYALCKECTEENHQDDHIHFQCKECGNTTCLEDVHVPSIVLPKGFRSERIEMVVSGTCKDCRPGNMHKKAPM
ncbi:MAG: transcriptional repressor [Williamsia sp.]|nr:transcriptional repressor [Williamsia sp.]